MNRNERVLLLPQSTVFLRSILSPFPSPSPSLSLPFRLPSRLTFFGVPPFDDEIPNTTSSFLRRRSSLASIKTVPCGAGREPDELERAPLMAAGEGAGGGESVREAKRTGAGDWMGAVKKDEGRPADARRAVPGVAERGVAPVVGADSEAGGLCLTSGEACKSSLSARSTGVTRCASCEPLWLLVRRVNVGLVGDGGETLFGTTAGDGLPVLLAFDEPRRRRGVNVRTSSSPSDV